MVGKNDQLNIINLESIFNLSFHLFLFLITSVLLLTNLKNKKNSDFRKLFLWYKNKTGRKKSYSTYHILWSRVEKLFKSNFTKAAQIIILVNRFYVKLCFIITFTLKVVALQLG